MLLASAAQPFLPVDLIEQTSELSQSGLHRRDRVMPDVFDLVRLAPCAQPCVSCDLATRLDARSRSCTRMSELAGAHSRHNDSPILIRAWFRLVCAPAGWSCAEAACGGPVRPPQNCYALADFCRPDGRLGAERWTEKAEAAAAA